jgi:hypothetical protein
MDGVLLFVHPQWASPQLSGRETMMDDENERIAALDFGGPPRWIGASVDHRGHVKIHDAPGNIAGRLTDICLSSLDYDTACRLITEAAATDDYSEGLLSAMESHLERRKNSIYAAPYGEEHILVIDPDGNKGRGKSWNLGDPEPADDPAIRKGG